MVQPLSGDDQPQVGTVTGAVRDQLPRRRSSSSRSRCWSSLGVALILAALPVTAKAERQSPHRTRPGHATSFLLIITTSALTPM